MILLHNMCLSAKMLYSAFEALVKRWYKYCFYTYLIELIRYISFLPQKENKIDIVPEVKIYLSFGNEITIMMLLCAQKS